MTNYKWHVEEGYEQKQEHLLNAAEMLREIVD